MSEENKYTAADPPLSPDEIPTYLALELRRIENAIDAMSKRNDIQFIEATADASSAEVVICDASATAIVVNLLETTASLGTRRTIVKTDGGANNVIVRSAAGINGSGSATLSAQYQQIKLLYDGDEWRMSQSPNTLETRLDSVSAQLSTTSAALSSRVATLSANASVEVFIGQGPTDPAWIKIATFSASSLNSYLTNRYAFYSIAHNGYCDVELGLRVATGGISSPHTYLHVTNRGVAAGLGALFSSDAFKLVQESATAASPVELWLHKESSFDKIRAVLIASDEFALSSTYSPGNEWQTAAPSGALELTSTWGGVADMLSAASDALNSDIRAVSSTLNSDIRAVSATLSTRIGDEESARLAASAALDQKIETLSANLDNDIRTVSATLSDEIRELSSTFTSVTWHTVGDAGEPGYLNGWDEFAATTATHGPGATFTKQGDGVVHMRGLIAGGSIGSPAFQLPVGYTPTYEVVMPAVSLGEFGELRVSQSGEVIPRIGTSTWFSVASTYLVP